MINKLGEHYLSSKLIAMDPVPLKLENTNYRVEFINDYFEGQLHDIKDSVKPNLFILDNVLEHVRGLHLFMENIARNTRVGDFVYVCVPSFDIICNSLQYHEIILEHVHYFTLNELSSLFVKYGFTLLEAFSIHEDSRAYNYHIFIKNNNSSSDSFVTTNHPIKNIEHGFNTYLNTLKTCMDSINSINVPIWGVCASELTPTLAYFMRSDFDFCQGIFDTSSHKIGKYMVNIKPKIVHMDNVEAVKQGSYFFLTAPALTYPVLRNLDKFNVKNVIVPLFFL